MHNIIYEILIYFWRDINRNVLMSVTIHERYIIRTDTLPVVYCGMGYTCIRVTD